MSDEARVALAHAGFHPGRTRQLLERYGDPRAVVHAVTGGRVTVPQRVRDAVAVDADTRLTELAAAGASLVLRGSPAYPDHLAQWPDAPDALFVRGRLPTLKGVAVVGTRRCTAYGRGLATDYGREISRMGHMVVSGLARGIDGAAHRGSVEAGAPGIAVLGCGIDITYPREHLVLAERLLEVGGAVVTEYPPGTPPEGWRFPPRNRIVAGLAAAVIVVEAPVTGGALITAARALDYGLPIFAVPGDVDRETSMGCNLLIRDGAHPVLDAEDLVEELGLMLGPVGAPPGNR